MSRLMRSLLASAALAAALIFVSSAHAAVPAAVPITVVPGDGYLRAEWSPQTASPPIDEYQVYLNSGWQTGSPRCTPTGTTYRCAPASATSFTWTGLTNGTSYTLRASAHNADGYGPWGAAIAGTPTAGPEPPPAPPEPTAPTGLVVTAGDGRCDLDWADNPAGEGVIDYQVYLNGGYQPYREVVASSFSDTGLLNGTTRRYRVSAQNEIGYGPWGPEVSCTPTGGEPPPPPPPPQTGVFDNPFVNSKTKVLASTLADDPNSAQQVAIAIGAGRNVNSGRGPTIFGNGEARWQGLGSHNLWTIRGASVGGSTTIHAPDTIACTSGVDPTLGVYDESTGKIARLYGGDSGGCTKDSANRIITGQNLGVDTNRDGRPEQGIGTAWGLMSGVGLMRDTDNAFNEGVKVALGNNLLDAGASRSPALSQESKATGPNYPAGVPAGARFCHVWSDAQIDAFQATGGLSGTELAISDAFWREVSCATGRGIFAGDGTGNGGFNLYLNAADLEASETQLRFAVRMPSGHNSGGAASGAWANSGWRMKVATP